MSSGSRSLDSVSRWMAVPGIRQTWVSTVYTLHHLHSCVSGLTDLVHSVTFPLDGTCIAARPRDKTVAVGCSKGTIVEWAVAGAYWAGLVSLFLTGWYSHRICIEWLHWVDVGCSEGLAIGWLSDTSDLPPWRDSPESLTSPCIAEACDVSFICSPNWSDGEGTGKENQSDRSSSPRKLSLHRKRTEL